SMRIALMKASPSGCMAAPRSGHSHPSRMPMPMPMRTWIHSWAYQGLALRVGAMVGPGVTAVIERAGSIKVRRSRRPPAGRAIRLGAGEPDHLGPLLGIVGDRPAEVGGPVRLGVGGRAHLGEPRTQVRILERRVDLAIEQRDHLRGRILRRAQAAPRARLVA